MKHTLETLKEAVKRFYVVPTNDNARKCKEELEGFEKEFHDLYLLLRDAYNQLERGQNMDMVKLGSSIRVAFKKSKEILGEVAKEA